MVKRRRRRGRCRRPAGGRVVCPWGGPDGFDAFFPAVGGVAFGSGLGDAEEIGLGASRGFGKFGNQADQDATEAAFVVSVDAGRDAEAFGDGGLSESRLRAALDEAEAELFGEVLAQGDGGFVAHYTAGLTRLDTGERFR